MKFVTGWYVLYVRSRCERKVDEYLKDISIESFAPHIKTIRQWSDRKKMVLKPLFPSYVFVNVKTSLEFHQALSAFGACAYISFGDTYARVSEKEIHQIKLLIGDSNIVDFEVTPQLPKVGDMKKITYGPLRGLHCKIVRANNMNKIIVNVESLQQNITVTTPVHYLEEV
ncbi:transcription antitermination protein RfaH [Kordia sp. SMS9]|uniref:UpxY family transcription antiterminator n=1 Tax=Kordia sp. SMS9 TaxID=2282170 RepID=UPI000E0D990F|nr:UpxY family transcription antiterminator [Kordia sp. SMS9]AXG72415.1 transcription antitermination protein RfaH [Kordia sp. SMS9]